MLVLAIALYAGRLLILLVWLVFCFRSFFCSEADPAAPGTDKDVDYYQHKSTASENFMPQRTGWEAAADNKAVSDDRCLFVSDRMETFQYRMPNPVVAVTMISSFLMFDIL